MLIVIPSVLPRDEALELGRELAAADWVDGNVTSGEGAALAKRNRQLPADSPIARRAQRRIGEALAASPLLLSASLPKAVLPPLFNRYGVGDRFGEHIDNALRIDAASGRQMRTDLSATLFLSEDYDGGELTVSGNFGSVSYRQPAGDLLLYPATSLHSVNEITRGERFAAFFWIESLVRDGAAREMLFDLDQTVQTLSAERGGDDPQVLKLTQLYHNLVRRWT